MRRLTCRLAACALVTTIPLRRNGRDASAESRHPAHRSATTLAASGVTLNGYVDAAYSYLSGDGVFTSGVADRVF